VFLQLIKHKHQAKKTVPSFASTSQPNEHELSAPALSEATSQPLQIRLDGFKPATHHLVGGRAQGGAADQADSWNTEYRYNSFHKSLTH
jgi:hypothetical protein